jgi:hypothetical protein
MRKVQDIAVPSVRLPEEIGAKWGMSGPDCLRLFEPDLPDRLRYFGRAHFIVQFPHRGSSDRIRFLFAESEGLRRLELEFDPGTGFWDDSDFWAPAPREDYRAVFDLFVKAYESELGPPELWGERPVDKYSSGLVVPMIAEEVATWPLPEGRLEVALIYEPYTPSWRRPPWEVRQVQVAWCRVFPWRGG